MTEEYSKFEAIADQWWDEDGKFSILHHINPLRIKYIVNQIKNKKNFILGCPSGRSLKNTYKFMFIFVQ